MPVVVQGPHADVAGRGQAAYEVRVYSLAPGGGFGSVLGRRPVRAAHCLTSIQFSPTGQLLLLAYGRCGSCTLGCGCCVHSNSCISAVHAHLPACLPCSSSGKFASHATHLGQGRLRRR